MCLAAMPVMLAIVFVTASFAEALVTKLEAAAASMPVTEKLPEIVFAGSAACVDVVVGAGVGAGVVDEDAVVVVALGSSVVVVFSISSVDDVSAPVPGVGAGVPVDVGGGVVVVVGGSFLAVWLLEIEQLHLPLLPSFTLPPSGLRAVAMLASLLLM